MINLVFDTTRKKHTLKLGTSKKPDVCPSFSKGERKYAIQEPGQRKETFRRPEQGRHQEAIPTLKNKFRREIPSRLTQNHMLL
jgi:hypothetical protein